MVVYDFAKNLNNSQQVDTILQDFNKAFDKVNHRKLLIKLDHYGIRGKLLDWMNDFLSERTQQVIINGESSSKGKVISGVPQATVLGPLLFLIYINDLPDRANSQIRLFADDSYLYKTIDTPQDTLQLQKDLDALTKWENEWSMEFHPDKCKLLHITNKLKPIEASYYMHNHKLDIVETGKYLGVFFLSLNSKKKLKGTARESTQNRQRSLYGIHWRRLWAHSRKKNVHKIQNINNHNTRENRLKKLNRSMVCTIMGGGGGGNLLHLKASRLVNLPEFRIYVMVSVIINPLETGLNTLLPYTKIWYKCSSGNTVTSELIMADILLRREERWVA